MLYKFGIVILRFILLFVFRIKRVGYKNVPKEGGVIVAYNHRSYWDPVMAGITCPRKLRFMAKEELFKNKLFGALIKALGAFPVSRGKGDIGAIKAARKILVNDSGAMLIFPEGRRVTDGKRTKAKAGVIAIAQLSKVPVVPACISGEYKWMHKITVTYGEPVYLDFTKKLSAGEMQEKADGVLQQIYEMDTVK